MKTSDTEDAQWEQLLTLAVGVGTRALRLWGWEHAEEQHREEAEVKGWLTAC